MAASLYGVLIGTAFFVFTKLVPQPIGSVIRLEKQRHDLLLLSVRALRAARAVERVPIPYLPLTTG